jgi:hypothetical protein
MDSIKQRYTGATSMPSTIIRVEKGRGGIIIH